MREARESEDSKVSEMMEGARVWQSGGELDVVTKMSVLQAGVLGGGGHVGYGRHWEGPQGM